MSRKSILVRVLALFGLSTVCFGETLEAVEKQLAEKIGEYKTLQYKQKTTSEMSVADAQVKVESEGIVKYARRPENKWVSRNESKTRTVRKLKDQPEEKQDIKILNICDGKDTYTLTETPDVTSAMKQKIDPATALNPFDSKTLFKAQRKDFELKLLRDEKVDGAECYVLEGTPKKDKEHEALASTFSRSVSFYDKKTGLAVKSVLYNKDGKVMTTSIASDCKFNEPIAEDQFVFKAPAGVTVIDMSNPQPSSQPAQDTPKDTAKSESEPKTAKTADTAKQADSKETPAPEKKKDSAGKAVKGLLKGFGK